MDILKAGQNSAAASKPLPAFDGAAFDPDTFSGLVHTLQAVDGPQLGTTGRRAAGFTPDLLTGLHYYGNRLCPFAHRAFLALAEKGALDKIDYVHIDLKAPKPAWYKDNVCPAGTVPCVVDDGAVLWESSVVVEYVNDKFPEGPSLLPADPKAKALARMFVKAADGSAGSLYGAIRNTDESLQEAKQAELNGVLADWEARYKTAHAALGTSGPFFLGAEPSVADIAILPFLVRFNVLLQVYRGAEPLLSEASTPLLLAMLQAFKARPSFALTTPTPEFIAASYYDYVGGTFPPTA